MGVHKTYLLMCMLQYVAMYAKNNFCISILIINFPKGLATCILYIRS